MKTLTFNELRRIKDSLPDGAIKKIADRLGLTEETVLNYFGGTHYDQYSTTGIHTEKGPDGGIVCIDDSTILDLAMKMIEETDAEQNKKQ
ncbi:MAG: DNA-binding protein [Bacteroidales bacterium]|nr:DNA-binding protein [Bacteroidales bacterium]